MRHLPQRQGGTSSAGEDSRNNACAEVGVSAVVISILLGLLGGIGLERLRNTRKDFAARRDAYKALLALADR
jgi:hypothetical protein